MCLAAPVQILEIIDENRALVEKDNVRFSVSISLFPDLKVNDFVLVHAGFVIQKIDDREAEERIEMINELYRSEL